MIAFYLSTAPEQLELAHRELLAEIGKIAANGIAADQFESVRATVLSALVLQQQSPGSIARQAAVDMLFGLSATHHRDVHEHVLKLVPEDVRSLAAALLSDRAPVTAIVTQGP
jgi:predicted Zn-dependent peptidase